MANILSGFVKGDSITFEGTLGEDTTDWKIRAELYTSAISIKKGTANVTGGADDQILITDLAQGVFEVYIDEGQTTDFIGVEAKLEIEMQDADSKKYTVYQGTITFSPEKITWDAVT